MGSYIEFNDTLQITSEQGFPHALLNIETHKETPISLKDVEGKIFEFYDKQKARMCRPPDVFWFTISRANGSTGVK